ncbi:hypothetical protein Q5752_004093 [Cryptotrichosporon argae]
MVAQLVMRRFPHLALALFASSLVPAQALVNPTAQSSSLVAIVTDPSLNRDSCGSARWGSRLLWTCRDSGLVSSGAQVTFFSSSASYSSLYANDTPVLSPVLAVQPTDLAYPSAYLLSGDNDDTSFYPVLLDECGTNQAGACGNGTRYAIWPNAPPLVVSSDSELELTAYTWIKRAVIAANLSSLVADPATSLYKLTGNDTQSALPSVAVVAEAFWVQGEFSYGNYGGLVVNSTAYLYAVSSAFKISLARVAVGSIEDRAAYEYYGTDGWVALASPPLVDDTTYHISAGAGGGQGTFYYAPEMGYVWLGQPGDSVDNAFYVALAPAPHGPWTDATLALTVPNGDGAGFGAYSMQAHPGISAGERVVYVTYTQHTTGLYETPMYRIEWA